MIRIAIDGPGGAGKSTVARAVAERLGIDYIDTGAMYRAVGYKMLQQGIGTEDAERLRELLAHTEIDFSEGVIFLDGMALGEKIRTPEVSKMASACSALPEVRAKLVELQRKLGQTKSVVMDGRDIGTNVMTDAEYKFYVTAEPEERARRRYLELQQKGQEQPFQQVLAEITERDYRDTHRALNPLCCAKDAELLDTTHMTAEEVIAHILNSVAQKK